MSEEYVINILEQITTAKRENRDRAANAILENPSLVKDLVNVTFQVNNTISIKAAWVLEWICIHKSLAILFPYLDVFCKNLKHLTFDSAIRPCSKICEALSLVSSNENDSVHLYLKSNHIDQIIETGFDWLITPQKVAVRAYTMQALFLFGKKSPWVHQELEHLIRTKIIHESKGTKARGKHILMLIQKHKNSNH